MNSACAKVFACGENACTAQRRRPTVWGPMSYWHLYCLEVPRRRGLRIVRDDVFFFKANVIAHSLRRSSFPNRNCFAGLRFGWPPFGRLFGLYQGLHLFYQHRPKRRDIQEDVLSFWVPAARGSLRAVLRQGRRTVRDSHKKERGPLAKTEKMRGAPEKS